jgi:hypothetical protein
MTEPTKLFQETQPGPTAEDVHRGFVDTARSIAAICATRMLLMIAVATGAAIWIWTTWQPTDERLHVAIAFSLVFVLPQVALYWKRG